MKFDTNQEWFFHLRNKVLNDNLNSLIFSDIWRLLQTKPTKNLYDGNEQKHRTRMGDFYNDYCGLSTYCAWSFQI